MCNPFLQIQLSWLIHLEIFILKTYFKYITQWLVFFNKHGIFFWRSQENPIVLHVKLFCYIKPKQTSIKVLTLYRVVADIEAPLCCCICPACSIFLWSYKCAKALQQICIIWIFGKASYITYILFYLCNVKCLFF